MKTLLAASAVTLLLTAGAAQADNLWVKAVNQDVSGGTVTATEVSAEQNGWLVVHRTGPTGKPGPVVGYAPLKAGLNSDVSSILTEPVEKGEMLMLMIHSEDGGTKTGIFEYTLGAKEDGPIKPKGNLIMTVVTAE
jgi:hypothetical protein